MQLQLNKLKLTFFKRQKQSNNMHCTIATEKFYFWFKINTHTPQSQDSFMWSSITHQKSSTNSQN